MKGSRGDGSLQSYDKCAQEGIRACRCGVSCSLYKQRLGIDTRLDFSYTSGQESPFLMPRSYMWYSRAENATYDSGSAFAVISTVSNVKSFPLLNFTLI